MTTGRAKFQIITAERDIFSEEKTKTIRLSLVSISETRFRENLL